MILFADIISLFIVLYTWFRLYDNHHIDKLSKRLYTASGLWLIILLILDQIWQILFESEDFSDLVNKQMNVITCIIYLMLPLCIGGMIFMPSLKSIMAEKIVDFILIAGLAVVPVINIWKPILFYHEEKNIFYTDFYKYYFIFELLVLVTMIRQYYVRTFPFDYSDNMLLAFAQIIVSLGVIADLLYNDLTITWNCFAMCYLMLLLAIEQMFAKLDSVTKLHNRNAYVKRLFRLKRVKNVTIVMFDLNRLKHFNDNYGHSAGDAYLLSFGQTIKKKLEDLGELFRVGGDEFCFVSTKANKESLNSLLTELRKTGKCDPEFGDYPLDFAFGIAERKAGENLFATVEKADIIMYEDKDKQRMDRPDAFEDDRSYIRREAKK